MVSAVLWDFGGVILTSPFEAFARYEREQGLPEGFIRRVNATNPLDNAWARLEREAGPGRLRRQFGPRRGRWAARSPATRAGLLAGTSGRRWSRRSSAAGRPDCAPAA